MKHKIIIIFVILGLMPVFSETLRSQLLPNRLLEYKTKYQELLKALKIDEEDLSSTEILEIIAVQYSERFDKTQESLTKLNQRLEAMEGNVLQIRTDLDETIENVKKTIARVDIAEQNILTLNESIKAHDEDLDKVFNWSNKVNGELFDSVALGAIGGLRERVRMNQNVINNNAAQIRTINEELSRQQQAINNLYYSIRSL